MQVRSVWSLIVFGAVFLTLAACGGESTSEPAAANRGEPTTAVESAGTAINPCDLLTREDARQALGADVKDASVQRVAGMAPGTRCTYVTSAPREVVGGLYTALVQVYDTPTFRAEDAMFDTAEEYFRRSHKATLASGQTPAPHDVSGVGEAAFWEPGVALLHVLQDGVYVIVSVRKNFGIPPGPSEEVKARQNEAQLQAARDLAASRVLPKLDERQ